MLYNFQNCVWHSWLDCSPERQEAFTLQRRCWWPGDTRSRVISSHGIVLFLLECPSLCHRRTKFRGRFFSFFFIYSFCFRLCMHGISWNFQDIRTWHKEQLVTFGGSSGAPSHNYSGFFSKFANKFPLHATFVNVFLSIRYVITNFIRKSIHE